MSNIKNDGAVAVVDSEKSVVTVVGSEAGGNGDGNNGNGDGNKDLVAATATDTAREIRPENPMTIDAYRWMTNGQSIPGAWAPLLYIGLRKVEEVYRAVGHQLSLDEVKILVQPDGKIEKCAVDGIGFQPIRYLAFLTPEATKELQAGRPLAEVELNYGGSFYVTPQEKIIAISGSILAFVGGNYVICHRSALAKAAIKQRDQNHGKPKWGMERAMAEDVLARIEDRRAERHERFQERENKFDDLFAPKQRKGQDLGRGRDGFRRH